MFPYWTFLKYGIPFLIGAVVFGGAAWKIQGQRLDVCKTQQKVCVSANEENIKTITAQKAEIEKGNKSCEARIKSKDTVIKRLKVIDALTSENISTGEDTANETVDNRNSDAIVSELNVMFKQSNSKD
jgi:hypothetical protein